MKKIVSTVLALIIGVSIVTGCNETTDKISIKKNDESIQNGNDDLVRFFQEIESLDSSFRDHYEDSRIYFSKILDALQKEEKVSVELQQDAIKKTKKIQRELNELQNKSKKYKNSANQHVKNLACEYLKFIDYASEIIEQHYNFYSAPEDYVSRDDAVNKLAICTAQFTEQSEYLEELVQKINEKESTSISHIKPIEFQETKEEKKSLSKWKNKTTDQLISDADQGDPAALHLMGMCYRYGFSGFPINIDAANKYFAASASLGFAPALDQIRLMHLEDANDSLNRRLFLQMVYLNLISTFGHTEFTMGYHDLRKEIKTKMGEGIVKEIEKIATQKTMKIYETKNAIEASKNKETDVMTLLTTLGIVGEDSEFEGDYWYNIFDNEKMMNNTIGEASCS